MAVERYPAASVSAPDRTVTVLIIGEPGGDRESLRSILSHSNWVVHEAASKAEAVDALLSNRISVVLCGCELADGDWRNILEFVGDLPNSPPLIVTSRRADDSLWAEVLNLGGYDLLPAPFDRREVIRVTGVAWLQWKDKLPIRPLTAAACG
ncbi:MAG: response regulator [Bryobacteraceae bacterium]